MLINYSSDLPISLKSEDRFQRYDFAKTIAETISKKENDTCAIIGIYGGWGEGKTSILNFIEQELDKQISIPIRFNPWRYKGEEELLKQFFEIIAKELKTELLTKKEKRGTLFKRLAQWTQSVKIPAVDISKLLDNVGESLNSIGVEALKERINQVLKETSKKVVIIIDDIDRLDTEELYAIFRLVKLNADFSNTTYILSYDESIVADAIGARFGKKSIYLGKKFLEKIVQVPLQIPSADVKHLWAFYIEKMKRILTANGIVILNADLARLEINLSNSVLSELRNPRQIVQYCNSISFLLPLLKEHVNIVDLLLIEAVKIYYPDHYNFIKDNSDYFISTTAASFSYNKEIIEIEFKKVSKGLSKRCQKAILDLCCALFPILNYIINDKAIKSREEIWWHKEKRIASPNYFTQYFSFNSSNIEILKNTFEEFILQLREKDHISNTERLKELINKISAINFLYRIRNIQEDFSWGSTRELSLLIFENSSLFPGNGYAAFFSGELNLQKESIKIICDLILKHNNHSEQVLLAEELIKVADKFETVLLFENYLGPFSFWQISYDNSHLNYSDESFYRSLLDRALIESSGTSIVIAYPFDAYRLLKAWEALDVGVLTEYLTRLIVTDMLNVLDLIKVFSETVISSAEPYIYKKDHSASYYLELIKIVDKQLIKEKINNAFTPDEIQSEILILRHREEPSNLQRAKQFIHWYENPNELQTSTNPW